MSVIFDWLGRRKTVILKEPLIKKLGFSYQGSSEAIDYAFLYIGELEKRTKVPRPIVHPISPLEDFVRISRTHETAIAAVAWWERPHTMYLNKDVLDFAWEIDKELTKRMIQFTLAHEYAHHMDMLSEELADKTATELTGISREDYNRMWGLIYQKAVKRA